MKICLFIYSHRFIEKFGLSVFFWLKHYKLHFTWINFNSFLLIQLGKCHLMGIPCFNYFRPSLLKHWLVMFQCWSVRIAPECKIWNVVEQYGFYFFLILWFVLQSSKNKQHNLYNLKMNYISEFCFLLSNVLFAFF